MFVSHIWGERERDTDMVPGYPEKALTSVHVQAALLDL